MMQSPVTLAVVSQLLAIVKDALPAEFVHLPPVPSLPGSEEVAGVSIVASTVPVTITVEAPAFGAIDTPAAVMTTTPTTTAAGKKASSVRLRFTGCFIRKAPGIRSVRAVGDENDLGTMLRRRLRHFPL